MKYVASPKSMMDRSLNIIKSGLRCSERLRQVIIMTAAGTILEHCLFQRQILAIKDTEISIERQKPNEVHVAYYSNRISAVVGALLQSHTHTGI